MTEFGFLISYSGRAWVTVEADTIEEARYNLLESSCAVDDYATIRNSLDFDIEIEKEDEEKYPEAGAGHP